MVDKKNILWIMCDQLRFDYLSCYGNKNIATPHIDSIAKKGTLFHKAYIQSPVCASSRTSYYTGKYVDSHGVWWNDFPLSIDIKTLGDYVKDKSIRNVLIGKSHATANIAGLKRLGIDEKSSMGKFISQYGFEAYCRHDGLYPDGYHQSAPYTKYLKSQQYEANNPWHDNANSARDDKGNILSGWLYENSDKAAAIKDEDSETAFITHQAMQFMDEMEKKEDSWICHLSYIKPHWPYMVSEPYFSQFKDTPIPSAKRDISEIENEHPLLHAYRKQPAAITFKNEKARQCVIPTYMAMIKQIDDYLGKLFAFMQEKELDKNTMIVFTSDHGDYLGDHFMGEKDFFHEEIIKTPLIIYDPFIKEQPKNIHAMVEAIDLVPTFLDYYNIEKPRHILEGRSLYNLLQGKTTAHKQYVYAEYDYSMMAIRRHLKQPIDECRIYMVFDGRYKYIKPIGFEPLLFDLQSNPDEFDNIANAHSAICLKLDTILYKWLLRNNNHTSFSYEEVDDYKYVLTDIPIGYWDEAQMHDDIKILESLISKDS